MVKLAGFVGENVNQQVEAGRSNRELFLKLLSCFGKYYLNYL